MSTETGFARGMWLLAFPILVLTALLADQTGAHAVTAAEAASKSPVTISIFLHSRADECFDRGDVPAIRRLAALEAERINRSGGIGGHKLEILFLDDKRGEALAIANMQQALAVPNAVAMVGLSSSDRAKAVFQATGTEIMTQKIPHLSAISVSSIFADYPNVFSMRSSQEEERLPVLVQFAKRTGVKKPAFVGLKDTVFSMTLGDGLKAGLGAETLVADHRLPLVDEKLDPNDIAAVVADLVAKAPDLVFLGIGQDRNQNLLKELMAKGFTPPLFLSGRIDALPADIVNSYPATIYELAWDRLPDLHSDRMLGRVALSPAEDWIFEGGKIADAPGWAKGECKERPEVLVADPLTKDNIRAIGVGLQYADMLGLVASAARTADPNAGIAELRAHIIEQLRTSFAAGRGAYQGAFENWSFLPGSRTATRTPFIVQRTPGMKRTQLAPLQLARLRGEKLRTLNTLYLDVDLIRVLRVDDSEKSFFAEFYVSMRDEGKLASIDNLEFSNAFLNPETGERQITIRVVSDGGKSDAFPDDTKVYQVSGKFMFDPRLGSYPFDTQRFPIDVRPKGAASFIIQPPPAELRDQAAIADGWEPGKQFVTYDQEFVTAVDAKVHEQVAVPFYEASFVWLMSRQTNDYYLRVVVPLLFILVVAYVSIFIPITHFEAIVTIQVTALLSAVALYLSLPTLDSDTTTLSDRLFLFNYLAVSLMIGISVMRMNELVASRPRVQSALGVIHVAVVPLLVLAVAIYIQSVSAVAH